MAGKIEIRIITPWQGEAHVLKSQIFLLEGQKAEEQKEMPIYEVPKQTGGGTFRLDFPVLI